MTTTEPHPGVPVHRWRPIASPAWLLLAAITASPLVAAAEARPTGQPAQATQATPPAPATAVAVGQAAPDFTLPYLVPKDGGGFDTRQVTLADFRGKKNVVLAFFPAAFSPG